MNGTHRMVVAMAVATVAALAVAVAAPRTVMHEGGALVSPSAAGLRESNDLASAAAMYASNTAARAATASGDAALLASNAAARAATAQEAVDRNASVTNEAALRAAGDAATLAAVSNGFLRVTQVSAGVWQHKLPGE